VFSEPLAARSRRRRLMERQLRDTLDSGGVDVHFQPVYDVWTGYLTGVEALARWNDPVLGEVSPGEFIEVAEECGLIGQMGEQILRKALRLMVGCGGIDRGVRLAVNVSTIQLRDPSFVGVVRSALEEAGVEPEQLVLEVTESVFVRPDDPAVQSITTLAEHGCPVAMDDFGSGYSSLGYLSRLPVKILKADMSLTKQLQEPRTLAIGRTIVQLATGLGLEVVFEGVSTPQQEALVRGLGARYVQGWLYARAMPVDELVAEMDRSCAPAAGARPVPGAPRPRRSSDSQRWASAG
jgi:EAL domain-containing protein (putative c-di-GMP-specific phosphodiesterase class I)